MFPASWVGRLGYFQLTSDLLVWLIKSDQTGRTSILHNNNSLPLGSPSTKELHGRVKHLVAKVFLGSLLVPSLLLPTSLPTYLSTYLPTYLRLRIYEITPVQIWETTEPPNRSPFLNCSTLKNLADNFKWCYGAQRYIKLT